MPHEDKKRQLTEVEARVLTRIQRDFPVTSRPFAALGAELGLREADVVTTVRGLIEDRLIRSLGPVFDPRALGYASTLCAASAPAERVDEVASLISARPEVTHNYLRDHRMNLWFTLIARPAERLAEIVSELERETGLVIHNLPALRFFKIRVEFDFGEGGAVSSAATAAAAPAAAPAPSGDGLTASDQAIIRALQEGLPAEERPFAAVAARALVTEQEIMEQTARFLEKGYMRRLGALVRHRATGVTANAMTVWNCPPERMAAAGAAMAQFKQVSHCYERPAFPGWPYNLFAMVHATTPEECRGVGAQLAEATGLTGYDLLFSTRELKKSSMKYFTS